MKNFLFSAMALAAFGLPSIASADVVADRTRAITLCRAEVAAQTGAEPSQVRLDQVNVRPRLVRVDFDLWTDGQLRNIRCEVTRGAELTIASITPSLQVASN
ncbi:MAG: hypothetical protein DCF16_18165 [Alphaproteobacteria bacterium]|nr:MAG: hypothetical protein DCF16_18165 [Alphaproteobacteria bacterium]